MPDLMSTYAETTKLLLAAGKLGKLKADLSLESIIARCAILSIEDGPQIGTIDVFETLEGELIKLQESTPEIIKLDPSLEPSLKSEEQDFQKRSAELMNQLKEVEAKKWLQEKKILSELDNAPDKQPYKEKFSDPAMEILEQKSTALRIEVFKLLTDIQNARQKRVDKYKKLLNSIDETQKNNLTSPEALEPKLDVNKLKDRYFHKETPQKPHL